MRVCIIGGGPCGILAAIKLKKEKPSWDVILLEKNEDIGQRIKVSGNGKCNFFNENISSNKYSSFPYIDDILLYRKELFSLLDEASLSYFHDEEGRYYPTSESSSTILYVLKNLLKKYKVEVKTSFIVEDISSNLINKNIKFDKLIVCIGGVSSNYDRVNYNNMINLLGVSATKLSPSLSPLSTSKFSPKMEGKRIKTNVSLYNGNTKVKEEYGEVIFKKDGISGIVILNMSSYLSRLHLSSYSSFHLELDLAPSVLDENLNKIIKNDPTLYSLLIKEIADEVVSRGNLFNNIRHFKLDIRGIYEFKFSQVTSGGISNLEITNDLSLKKNKNIYAGGELLDVDGECGGYNIGFAFLSGLFIAGKIIENEKK